VTEQDATDVDAVRVARRLLAEERRLVAMLPLASAGAIEAPICALGRALVDVTGETVALIDVAGSWELWAREPASAGDLPYVGRWLYDARLAALRPTRRPQAGEGLGVIRLLLGIARSRCPYALVDLSGLRAAGEHLGAFTLVDGVCLIARAGKTRERELLAIYEQLEPHKNLGVLLLSAD
jgi:hypothetical protein